MATIPLAAAAAAAYQGGMLNLTTMGAPDAPTLLIVHGLFGSGRNWGVIAKRLSDRFHVITPDMRNHGDSPWFDSHGYADMAADLAEVIDAHGGRAHVVGHSMGGKASMVLALRAPEKIASLVVADIAPVPYGHSQARYIHAMRAVDPAGLRNRSEAREQLAPHVPDPALQSFFAQSLDLETGRWKLNLDALEAEMPRIMGFPEVAGHFDGPVLFLSGGTSDYVRPEHRDTIRGLFPKARFAKLPKAGHWLHAEDPRGFEATVRTFLSRVS